MAAALACGRGAYLSHRSAARLWGLIDERPRLPEVTVAGRQVSHPGIAVRRSAGLASRDRRVVDRIPLTSPTRTLVDLATVCDFATLELAAARANARHMLGRAAVEDQLERCRGRRGVARLRATLRIEGGPALTRSSPERLLLRLVRDAGLPPPEVNVVHLGFELDLFWRRQGVVVEVDSRAWHTDPAAFERDRLRDAELQAHGLRVLRFTANHLRRSPNAALSRLRRTLAMAER